MDKPPSDPADHAEDFSQRPERDLEIATGQVMIDLGMADDRMGARDKPSLPMRRRSSSRGTTTNWR